MAVILTFQKKKLADFRVFVYIFVSERAHCARGARSVQHKELPDKNVRNNQIYQIWTYLKRSMSWQYFQVSF